jgi:hypothetical protein
VLADTLFLDAPPPHSEIRRVLDNGIKVFGCASAGALRAIELERHGMRGIGWIYHLFRMKLLNDDGELASVLDADFRVTAPPLVQIRYCLGHLVAAGWPPASAGAAFREIRSLYFMRRTAEAVAAVINAHCPESVSPQLLSTPDKHIKAIDLMMCLRRVGLALPSPAGAPTIDLRALKAAVALERDNHCRHTTGPAAP